MSTCLSGISTRAPADYSLPSCFVASGDSRQLEVRHQQFLLARHFRKHMCSSLFPFGLPYACCCNSCLTYADSASSAERSPREDQSRQGLVLHHKPDWHVLLHRAHTSTGPQPQLLCFAGNSKQHLHPNCLPNCLACKTMSLQLLLSTSMLIMVWSTFCALLAGEAVGAFACACKQYN